MENLPQDFKEFLALLNKYEVEYLLLGGYAVALHGYPRYTGDIDFWVDISDENSEKIVLVLKEFGFDLPELSKEMFLDPDRMTRMGREPLKIKILNSISGLTFDEARNGAISINVDGVYILVIGLRELRLNKKASGRAKDLADLEDLLYLHASSFVKTLNTCCKDGSVGILPASTQAIATSTQAKLNRTLKL